MVTTRALKLTGVIVLLVGILFFLRDNGLNLIGNTSGWSILIVLIGASILSSKRKELINNFNKRGKPSKKK